MKEPFNTYIKTEFQKDLQEVLKEALENSNDDLYDDLKSYFHSFNSTLNHLTDYLDAKVESIEFNTKKKEYVDIKYIKDCCEAMHKTIHDLKCLLGEDK